MPQLQSPDFELSVDPGERLPTHLGVISDLSTHPSAVSYPTSRQRRRTNFNRGVIMKAVLFIGLLVAINPFVGCVGQREHAQTMLPT